MRQDMGRSAVPAGTRSGVPGAATILPVLALPLTGLLLFASAGRDDAYITFWAGQALARFGHIVNYNGEFLEQSSSLAQVVLLGLAARIVPLPVSELGLVIAVLFGCAAVVMTGRLARELSPDSAVPARWLAATAAGLVYWSFGGLETSMAAFIYGAYAVVLARAVVSPLTPAMAVAVTVLSGVLAAVRPEGAVLGAAVLAGLWVWSLWFQPDDRAGRPSGALTFASLVLVAVTGSLELWRHWDTGAWFAQPVTAKAGSLDLGKLVDGIRYLGTGGARVDGLVWVLAGVAALYWLLAAGRRRRVEPVVMVASLFVAGGYAFILLNGGDWMEGHRFMVPLLPAAVVLFIRASRAAGGARLVQGAIALQVVGTLWLAHGQSSGSPLWTAGQPDTPGATWFERRQRINYRDAVFSNALLEAVHAAREQGNPNPVVMSVQMGLASYKLATAEFGRVRFVDLMALTTRDFTSCPLSSHLRHGQLGLAVDLEFYLRHRVEFRDSCGIPEPDIIFDLDKPDWREARLASGLGYRVVYQQSGPIASGSRLFPGLPVNGEEFIAVRQGVHVRSLPGTTFGHG